MAVLKGSGLAPAAGRGLISASAGDFLFKGLTLLMTLAVLLLAGLAVFAIVTGSAKSIERFGFWGFPVSAAWDPVAEDFGALYVLVGTLVSSILALVVAVPVALGIALFITEMAPPALKGPVAFLVDILAAIPSIVYGLWGFFVLVPLIRGSAAPFLAEKLGWIPLFEGPSFGVSMLAAGLVLAIMVVPIVSAVAREVIYQVPREQKEGLIALGATKWEVIWKVVLPYARSGIVGAVILGLARAVGETMAVTMVIGNAHELSWSLLKPASTMASVIANEFTEATSDLYQSALIHVGLVLMAMALTVNVVARLLVWSVARAPRGATR